MKHAIYTVVDLLKARQTRFRQEVDDLQEKSRDAASKLAETEAVLARIAASPETAEILNSISNMVKYGLSKEVK